MDFFDGHFQIMLLSSVSLSINVEWFRWGKHSSGFPFIFEFSVPDAIHYRIEIDEWGLDYNRNEEAHSMFVALANLGPFHDLRQISISSRSLPGAKALNILLGKFPVMEEIVVKTRDAAPFIAALGSHYPPGAPCPSLHKLDLRGSKFDPRQLRDIIIEREEAHHQLRELCLSITQQRLNLSDPDLFAVNAAIRVLNLVAAKYTETGDYWTSSSEEDG